MARVTVYTTRWCMFCAAAKRLLTAAGVDFEEVALDGRPELRRQVSDAHGGWPTVPMILIGDRFVGGYDDLARLHRAGELTALLDGAAGSSAG